MALLEAINAARPTNNKSVCGVRRVLMGLSGADASDLKAALENPAIEHTAIAKGVAVALGLKLAPPSVGRHRKGECSCQ